MDVNKIKTKIIKKVSKYKYAIIIVLVGIVLMLIPSTSKNNTNNCRQVQTIAKEDNLAEELSELLGKVSGAGNVEVYLTISKGEETIYQLNEDKSYTENGSNIQKETVIVSDSGRNEQGLITRTDPVIYKGAIVLCQGADRATVKLEIIEAVSKVTGLSTDCICVLKMK